MCQVLFHPMNRSSSEKRHKYGTRLCCTAALQPRSTTSCEQSELHRNRYHANNPDRNRHQTTAAHSLVSLIITTDPYHATSTSPLSTNNTRMKTHLPTKLINKPKKKRAIRTRSSPIEPTSLPTFPVQTSRKHTLLPEHDATSSSHTHICQRISTIK